MEVSDMDELGALVRYCQRWNKGKAYSDWPNPGFNTSGGLMLM